MVLGHWTCWMRSFVFEGGGTRWASCNGGGGSLDALDALGVVEWWWWVILLRFGLIGGWCWSFERVIHVGHVGMVEVVRV